MSENKKICVVGAGKWGMNHINTLSELNCLGGIVEHNKNNIKDISKQFPGIPIFLELEDTFKIQFDGYVVSTPAETHYDIAKHIINNGFSVLIEKPMTLNSIEAKELLELSNKNNVNVMVGHLLLFHPAIIKIKELIDNGKIGKLQYIYSNRLNLGQIRKEENVFWSLAPHDISILQYFIDSYPIDISCSGGAFVQEKIHDTTLTVLSYENNIKAHIYVSWLHPFKEHRLVVIGSDGMLRFEDSSTNKELIYYDKGYSVIEGSLEKKDGQIEVIKYEKKMPLKEELKYFINNIDAKEIKKSGAKDGFEIVKILESANNSLNKVEYSNYE